jgi:hypothetical protein
VKDDQLNDHLKCDEKRPSCLKCINHDVECSFTGNESSTTLSPEETSLSLPEARPQALRYRPYHYSTGELKQTFKVARPKDKQPTQLQPQPPPTHSKATQCELSLDGSTKTISLVDLQLFHHFTISTYKLMREEGDDTQDVWQKHLPEWGVEFPSILHLILALSALHLAHEKPEQREQYIEKADNRFNFGVRSVTAVLSQLNEDNCQKIYMAAALICFIYFARGPRPGEYLIFSESGPSEWLVLMNGVKIIVQSYHAKVFSGLLEPKGDKISYKTTPAMLSERHEHRVHLQSVQRLIEEEVLDLNEKEMGISAIQDLFNIMDEVYERVSGGKDGGSLMDLVIGWLYRRPEEFVHLLEQKEPRALVILAYWAVLLKYMESAWFMKGWPEHVMTGISGSLHLDYWTWIEWPLRKSRQA